MKYPYVIKVAVHHDCWSNPTENFPDAGLHIFGIGCNKDTAHGFTKITGTATEKKKLYEKIKNHPFVLETKKKSKDCFFIRVKKDTAFYTKLISNNYVVDNSSDIQDGIETEKLFGFSKKSLMKSLSEIREEREIKVVSIKPYEGHKLTQKEQELLGLAMKKGYYEIPRKNYINDLADELGLKKSVIADRLRKIERKIIQDYYGKN